jgi:hypothetical protein
VLIPVLKNQHTLAILAGVNLNPVFSGRHGSTKLSSKRKIDDPKKMKNSDSTTL